MFSNVDSNCDGLIDFDEFMRLWESIHKPNDLNSEKSEEINSS